MAAERGKILCDGLLISNIGENLLEHRQLTARLTGNLEATLGHDGEKSQSLQRYGFTAGVWSSDQQCLRRRTKSYGNRDALFGVKQWMPALANIDAAFVV